MNDINLKLRARLIKLTHWEYWNSTFIYLPVLPYLLFLWIKSRNIFFFNAANPGIEFGGFLMESKWKIYKDAPQGFFPNTVLVSPSLSFDDLIEMIQSTFHFPCIAKPDMGSKGRGVVIIRDMEHLRLYHNRCPVNYLVQTKIEFPMEVGIFYVRKPHEMTGRITGIVQKEFITVTGNGRDNVEKLILLNPRYAMQLNVLKQMLETDVMQCILPEGETRTLLDIGNHARGSEFIDATNKISTKLEDVVDKLCKTFPGFYFGRLDIRFASWEALERGEGFVVIELNGSGSEPTHIYDPKNSIFFAWKEICRHWKLMQKVSEANHRNGTSYLSWREGIGMFRNNNHLDRKLALFTSSL